MKAREVSFTVEGLPPAKGEALSMLGQKHPQTPRVRALLEAAQQALGEEGWTEVVSDQIGLDVVVRTPARGMIADATNMLGGIGDTLQRKVARPTLSLDHLGDLSAVALYTDDRQIREVHYQQEDAVVPSYTVRIWVLG